MVSKGAQQLNYFPAKRGISKHYSPRMIMHQENLDFDHYFIHVLGEYVQLHEDENIKNNNASRALDSLYIRPAANS